MKKIFFVLLTTVAFFSCKKDDVAATNYASTQGVVKGEFSGAATASVNASTTSTSFVRTTGNGITSITIAAAIAGGKSVSIFLSNITTTGTYAMGSTGSAAVTFANSSAAADTYSTINFVNTATTTAGSVIITSISATNITGSFSGNLRNTNGNNVAVASGSFDGKF